MISTKHSNRSPRDVKSFPALEIQSRDAAIKAKDQALDSKRAHLDKNVDKTVKPSRETMNEKHTLSSRGRSQASTNKERTHDAEEQSPTRGRTYAISGESEFRKAFCIDSASAQDEHSQ